MTEQWGSTWWAFLHSCGEHYPCRPTAAQRRAARRVVRDVSALLPCPKCQRHFCELLRQRPPEVGSRRRFAEWLWWAHNEVNKRLGKPEVAREDALAGLEPCDGGEGDGEGDGGDERGRWGAAVPAALGLLALAAMLALATRRRRRA